MIHRRRPRAPWWAPAAALMAAASASAQAPVPVPAGAPALSWHGALGTEAYDVDVRIPEGGGGASWLRPGQHHKTTVWGDVRLQDDDVLTHLQFALTGSDDRAVLARYQWQAGTLQVGRTARHHQVLAGDVAAQFSRLAPGAGLRGVLAAAQAGPVVARGYAGLVADNWESLWGRRPVDGGPARTGLRRHVRGAQLSVQPAAGIELFATHQGWSDQAGAGEPGAPSGSQLRGHVATAGVSYATALGPSTRLQAAAEAGRSQESGGQGEAAGDGRAALLELSLASQAGASGALGWQARVARRSAGAAWRGPSGGNQPGVQHSTAALDVQWAGLGWAGVELRRTRTAQPDAVGGEVTRAHGATWRVGWWPARETSVAVTRTTERSTAVAADSDSRQDSVSIDRGFDGWSLGWVSTRLAVDYATHPWANGRSVEHRLVWRAALPPAWTAGHAVRATLTAGHQTQRTHYPTHIDGTLAGLSLSGQHGARGTWSLELERRFARDRVNGQRYIGGRLGAQYQLALARGWSAQAFVRRNTSFQGLLSAEVVETTAGLGLSWQW